MRELTYISHEVDKVIPLFELDLPEIFKHACRCHVVEVFGLQDEVAECAPVLLLKLLGLKIYDLLLVVLGIEGIAHFI